jgi:CrcB protein
LRIGSIALVFAGGTVGAGAREALTVALPLTDPVPIAILIANLLGAFLLGLLLEALARDTGSGVARTRLLLGTGLLGGFTTYSALALAVAQLLVDGRPWHALAYGLGTVVFGALVTWGGIVTGAAVQRSRRDGRGAGGARV